MPPDVELQHRPTRWGAMRSRAAGAPRAGVPEVVVVHGLGVADYLEPAVRELGTWTRAHLVELPGFAGSGEPPRPMDVVDHADAVVQWLTAAGLERPILVGHSSGTQVAAHVAARRPDARALVLASPTIDPAFRSVRKVLLAWRRNHELEPPDLDRRHTPDRQRAGLRRVRHALTVHLADRLEGTIERVGQPALVLYGDTDRLCTERWARELAERAPDGRFRTLPGAHSFVWTAPAAWSAPIEELAREVAGGDPPEPSRGR